MTKLLAALSIPEVGEINYLSEIDDEKGRGFIFQIEIKNRMLHLRTSDDVETAYKWVDTLIALRDRHIIKQLQQQHQQAEEVEKAGASNSNSMAASTSSVGDGGGGDAASSSSSSASSSSVDSKRSGGGGSAHTSRPSIAVMKREATAIFQKATNRNCLIL